MNYIEYTISLSLDNSMDAEMLIAYLMDAGFEGLEEVENEIHAFAMEGTIDVEKVNALLQEQKLKFIRHNIPDQNWNEAWEKDYHPIKVEDFCVIRAAFHDALPGVMHDLVITPKMSFGTGHHATTYLMITAMRDIDFSSKTVLDFGTGTGILAILAAKMGASRILAVDNDEWSIENAKENIVTNDCSNITVLKRDSTENLGVFDIIVANITRHVLLENLPGFWQQLKDGGVLILSGFFKDDEGQMLREAELNGLRKIRQYHQQEWICLELQKMQKA